MTYTSNQALLVTLTTVIGLIVLVALKDLTAAVALPLIGTLAGVHLGANTLPSSAATPTTTTVVTPVTGNKTA